MSYADVSQRILGAAMVVHSILGNGFHEAIYRRALAIELELHGLAFESDKEMPVHYRDQQIGTRQVDFFVEGMITVELKAVMKLDAMHFAQAMNYLQAYNTNMGLLLNFGAKHLEFKRVYNHHRMASSHPVNK